MSLPLKIKGKRVAKARNIELLEVPYRSYYGRLASTLAELDTMGLASSSVTSKQLSQEQR